MININLIVSHLTFSSTFRFSWAIFCSSCLRLTSCSPKSNPRIKTFLNDMVNFIFNISIIIIIIIITTLRHFDTRLIRVPPTPPPRSHLLVKNTFLPTFLLLHFSSLDSLV
mmetsp:Transcript_6033/g.21307  ORF Transcript_6033/g.21307 Transcript_6033/m.21307 type:complete len:111 (-) Transcript_6033:572-904(-)